MKDQKTTKADNQINEEVAMINRTLTKALATMFSMLPEDLIDHVKYELSLKDRAYELEERIERKARKTGVSASMLAILSLEKLFPLEAKEEEEEKQQAKPKKEKAPNEKILLALAKERQNAKEELSQNDTKDHKEIEEKVDAEIDKPVGANKEIDEQIISNALKLALKNMAKHNEKALNKKHKIHINTSSIPLFAIHKNMINEGYNNSSIRQITNELAKLERDSIIEHNNKHGLIYQHNARSSYFKEFLKPIKDAGKI